VKGKLEYVEAFHKKTIGHLVIMGEYFKESTAAQRLGICKPVFEPFGR